MTQTKNLHQRLAAVQKSVSYIQKEKKKGMRYSVVTHDVVTAKVRPYMVEHGIIYYPVELEHAQAGNRTEVKIAVRFVNVDDPADTIDVQTLGYGIDNQDKGPGMAISYAVKYALLKCLGLETGDDADQNQDVSHGPDPQEQPKPAPKSKAQSRAVYEELQDQLHKSESLDLEQFDAFMRRIKSQVESFPADWRSEFRQECMKIRTAITSKAA